MISKKNGISKTVYSLYLPDVEDVIDRLLKNTDKAFHQRYCEAHTSKQDAYHHTFFDTFKKWSEPVLDVDWNKLPFGYPTGGASEAIREQIVFLKAQGYERLYVFEGEYEGYEAIAKAVKIDIVKLPRDELIEKKYDYDTSFRSMFFLSNPNSINGCILNYCADYIKHVNKVAKNVRFYIDIVYIGTIESNDYKIPLAFDNVDGVFFSLSKSFGVYYHRIGGCFLKHENPLLYGNKWFKNILAMQIGEALMNEFDVFYLANKYKTVKQEAIKEINKKFDEDILMSEGSECYILTTAHKDDLSVELKNELSRRDDESFLRVCLTAKMEEIIRKIENQD